MKFKEYKHQRLIKRTSNNAQYKNTKFSVSVAATIFGNTRVTEVTCTYYSTEIDA